MSQGRIIAVVGPSGVGKDSVIAGLGTALPQIQLVRRVITRARDLGGEDYKAVTASQFETLVRDRVFAIHWDAHGLRYGIPATVHAQLDNGSDCLVNFSRRALEEAAVIFANLVVLNITARPETLAQRLTSRGREAPADIAARLAQATQPLPKGMSVIHLTNDSPLSDTIARAAALLYPARV